MATTTVDVEGLEWTPGPHSLWFQSWSDEGDGQPTAVLFRHPTAPYPDQPCVVDDVKEIDDAFMQKLAFAYLEEVHKCTRNELPRSFVEVLVEPWLARLRSGDKSDRFRWLPIRLPLEGAKRRGKRSKRSSKTEAHADPFVSFRVERESSKGLEDQTIVLLASEWLQNQAGDEYGYLGSEFGIRVVAHVRKIRNRKLDVRITGMSASFPFGEFLARGVASKDWSSKGELAELSKNWPNVRAEMARQLGLVEDSVSVRGVRMAEGSNDKLIEWRCTGMAERPSQNPALYQFVFRGTLSQAGSLVSKVELQADVTAGHAWVFPRDRASQGEPREIRKRRPTRPERVRNEFRVEDEITAGRRDPLTHTLPSGAEAMSVLLSPYVLDDKPGLNQPHTPKVKTVDLPGSGPAVVSNDMSAVMAFWNVRQFFRRLEAYRFYGSNPEHYFRIAKLPLKVYYRSGIQPGPGKDGETVNACVLVDGWPVDFKGPTRPGERPGLQMHLAMADLSTRARKPRSGKACSAAEPLGIAADARWIWHEIGHILLMASVGELQFRFAHSPGDALAAIASDPQSTLAQDANWRGATFPWVHTPRRHDRCVSHGWSWGGGLHYAASQVPMSQQPRRKAYWTEQILSSSLFRLYRSIGGDTTSVISRESDVQARESASHYSIYLIMRALQILGPGGIVPAHKPDQFVSALIDADIGTGPWDVTFPETYQTKRTFNRVGGCVHKVIRWAFEAQGLYRNFVNTPGQAPPVDIYIEDGRTEANRAAGGLQYGPGSYYPVSLDWDNHQTGARRRPAWQAADGAIQVHGNNRVSVTVGNRGTEAAQGVTVAVWVREWPSGDPPRWDNSWHARVVSNARDIGPKQSKVFSLNITLSRNKRYLVLAQANCADDRANNDPATALPCTLRPTPLIDLVAGDNNLGLRVIGRP